MATAAQHLGSEHAYTCQPWLATHIATTYFNGKYRIWVARALFPHGNGLSSNPLKLYEELEWAVQMNDYNHARIEQLRSRLMQWIKGSALPSGTKSLLLKEVRAAAVPAFRPSLWRVNLTKINAVRIISLGQFRDEYLIKSIARNEFEVIAGEQV